MKTTAPKINPEVFIAAAQIVDNRRTPRFVRYGCNAIQAVRSNMTPREYDNSNDISTKARDRLVENRFLASLFKRDAKRLDTSEHYEPLFHGYWGNPRVKQNKDARVIGLLLASEIAKE